MQDDIENSNAIDDMFVAFTMVQQIMLGLSGAASEEAVFSLLKCNGGHSSEASESRSIQCQ
jgi:hypothetical protein